MTQPALNIRDELRAFGARADDVVLLGEATPTQHIRYLDLIAPTAGELPRLSAVVEVGGQSVLYVVDCSQVRPQGLALARLRRILAFRAGADHLALLEPGRITLYPVAPSTTPPEPEVIRADESVAPAFLPSLAASVADRTAVRSPAGPSTAAVHDLLIGLLTTTTATLASLGIDHLDALSLVGRALFIRFLADRKILTDADVQGICGADVRACFTDAKHTAAISRWLDVTFNGDFLKLPEGGAEAWFRVQNPKVFHELGNILHRTDETGQTQLDWGDWGDGWDSIRFEHIPVGLLSQVYEHHAHLFDPEAAKLGSVLYTPRHIAEYMVDEVFFALGDQAADAHVLDPAAGGGVFLVEAFRRIVAACWHADDPSSRPDTLKLRRILYDQIRGFDISEPALRLCTLGLYLTAIELDPEPRPLSKQRFPKSLLGNVLFDVRDPARQPSYIGSLSKAGTSAAHEARYDVVLGNPPWSAWRVTGKQAPAVEAQIKEVVETIRPIVRARLGDAAADRYTMVDNLPDLPFIWRAMQWAKPGGQIAFALHARFLFKQSPQGRRSREDLLQALQVTGVVNGAAVRTSKFWPNVSAPFYLLFATNNPPAPDASFWFVSPELEKNLHTHARWRIDDASARPVHVADVIKQPTLLKTLFRGTELDAQIVRRIERLELEPLTDYWDHNGGKYYEGQGFKVGGTKPGGRKQQVASELIGLRQLKKLRPPQRLLDGVELPTIPRGFKCQHPRERTIYRAPLVIVAESPSLDPRKPNAYLALRDDVAYSQSFHGFSCAWHPEPELLARYLFLLFSSPLPIYRALLTSGKFGVERDIFEGDDMLQFPLRPLDTLQAPLRAQIKPLSQALIKNTKAALQQVESWAAAVYGLEDRDVQVIDDTFSVSAPFSESRNRAERRPTATEVEAYARSLVASVHPFLIQHGRTLSVQLLRDHAHEQWIVLQLDAHPDTAPAPAPSQGARTLHAVAEEADALAASRIVVVEPPARLLLAIVAQYRYFTPSRARLLGLDLVHEHAAVLLGGLD